MVWILSLCPGALLTSIKKPAPRRGFYSLAGRWLNAERRPTAYRANGMRLVVVGWWYEWCESLRQTPDEIVMLLELLDSRFKVNPWRGKSGLHWLTELAKCADTVPVLPKILFWTRAARPAFVSFEKMLCIQHVANRERCSRRQESAIWMKILNLFFMWMYSGANGIFFNDNGLLILWY